MLGDTNYRTNYNDSNMISKVTNTIIYIAGNY